MQLEEISTSVVGLQFSTDAPWRYRVGRVARPGALPRERFSPLARHGHSRSAHEVDITALTTVTLSLQSIPEEYMSPTIISSEALPKASPYFSHAVKAGGLVFVSGTAPYSPETGKLVGTTIQEQTAQALRNITAILEAAGTSLNKAVSATVILAEEEDFAGMNEEWLRWFPTNPPARQGAKLPVKVPGLKISVAMIAEG